MVKAQSHRSKNSVHRGAWTAEEDRRLFEYVRIHGDKKWRSLPARAGLNRCGKSCRLRWLNYLRPDIKRGSISEEEEDLIMRLHNLLGNRWSLIAGRLPGRTDNEIKNYWNTHLSKKCLSMGELNLKINKVKRSQKPLPVPIIITCALSSNPEATGEKFGLESQHPPYWSDLSEKDLETDLDINIDRFFDFTGAISSTEAEQGPCSSDLGDHQKPVHEENARNFSELLDCEQIPEMDFCHDPSNFDQIDLEMLSRFLESDMDSGHQPNAGVLSLAL